jgi:hypothetical protein
VRLAAGLTAPQPDQLPAEVSERNNPSRTGGTAAINHDPGVVGDHAGDLRGRGSNARRQASRPSKRPAITVNPVSGISDGGGDRAAAGATPPADPTRPDPTPQRLPTVTPKPPPHPMIK